MIKIKAIAIIVVASSLNLFAQFRSAEIGVDGLTCSACSRTVEMSIRKLNFVQDVKMNPERAEGRIIFKSNVKVSIEDVAKAVANAGYSLRHLNAVFSFNKLAVKDDYCFSFEGNQYQFVKTGVKMLGGEMTLKFLGKEFLSRKEYKKWELELKPVCDKSKGAVFYVTL
ncbi:MAG: heavy-metal-associated domain-containing protein [Bacteroidetes bacterium]|nr:heavy-metal-associated domain-containing protein [Bacteroidota bacterium]